MKIFKLKEDLSNHLNILRSQNSSIGFVPTMGALHDGHLSLIKASNQQCDKTVCSIFVNPTQFNNTADLEKYPRTIEHDIVILENSGCDILFIPEVDEIYPNNEQPVHYELGFLETILEGEFRPGHFQGVCRVVDILLNIINPSFLFLGQKDYQQCMVLKKMITLRNHHTSIVTIPTMREADGLAMSSRNMRLNTDQRIKASKIYVALQKMNQSGSLPLLIAKKQALTLLSDAGFLVDYLEVANANTLEILTEWEKTPMVILVAAYLGDIRLIDNLILPGI
ncbi:MAG: pantoate--beta-alanine ligase [Ferruginibacter sp.]|nr:pantoate--beta-alanine ligase [Ferruginibacter sp.]